MINALTRRNRTTGRGGTVRPNIRKVLKKVPPRIDSVMPRVFDTAESETACREASYELR